MADSSLTFKDDVSLLVGKEVDDKLESIMNSKTLIPTYLGIALLIVTSIVGALVATQLIVNYKVVVNGVLGVVVLYLIYRTFISSKRQGTDELNPAKLLIFPANIILFLRVFWWTMIVYWAFRESYIAVMYLIQLAGSGG